MAAKPLSVLFVDQGNSAASLMAEALLRAKGGEAFIAQSAGFSPSAHVHAPTLAILQEHGIPTDKLACKGVDIFQVPDQALKIDVVVRLGATAHAVPHRLVGVPACADWLVDEPDLAADEEQARWKARKAFDSLSKRIEDLVRGPLPATRGEMQMEIQRIGRCL